MDPASFSFAVIGMFLTCCKGYDILSNAYNAPSDAQDAARRVRIESSVLAAWGEHFEIRQGLQNQQGNEKLRIHLMRGQTLNGVFDALCAISETFTDITGLDKKYGVIFSYHSKRDGVGSIVLHRVRSITLITYRVLVYLEISKIFWMDENNLKVHLAERLGWWITR